MKIVVYNKLNERNSLFILHGKRIMLYTLKYSIEIVSI
jgi:hypothetical protein